MAYLKGFFLHQKPLGIPRDKIYMNYSVDVLIIGGGVVGLACGRKLALNGYEVGIVEKNEKICEETTSRNSGVIHAGIYYKPGSLKSKLCVNGRLELYKYLDERNLPYKKCSKLIVATNDDETERLINIYNNGIKNGVSDLKMLSKDDIKKIQPDIFAKKAIFSPSTGIFDIHDYTYSLLKDFEENSGMLFLKTNFISSKKEKNSFKCDLSFNESDNIQLHAKYLINASGLNSVEISKKIHSNYKFNLKQAYAKGTYFSLSGKHNFDKLIYPIPENGGLGVHLTLNMANQVIFGPDVEWVDEINYHVDEVSKSKFINSIKKYWPDIENKNISPNYSGVRPKISINNTIADDFLIFGKDDHGLDGFIDLLGIESPGLTSSLAIANHVSTMIES